MRHFAAGNAVGLVAHLREALATQDGGTVQWVILCFWLLNCSWRSKNADYPDLKGNIQSFLLGHINMLHIRTAFQLVSSHNRDGAANAGAVKAFENVILHLIDKHSIDSGVANFIFLERTNPA